MAENKEESVGESVMEKMMEKLHHDDSSSSDSDNETSEPSSFSVKSQVYRLFGREKPVHTVLGGGKRTKSSTFLRFYFLKIFLKNPIHVPFRESLAIF